MITVLIVVLVSVIVLDIVVISRAVHRIRVERRVKADPLSLHDPGPRPARRDRVRWLEPAGASQDPGSRPRGTSQS